MPRLLYILTLTALFLPAQAATGDTVILIHGLGRTRWSLYRVERALKSEGYTVVNVTYPSRAHSIEALAQDYLGPLIAAHASAKRIHFVTHSLGGIILRCYLRDHALPNLGRVVMLAPPNTGSQLADRLKSTWLYRTVNGPAGQQLGVTGLVQTLGPWPKGTGELGIIAGDVSLNPIFSASLPGPNDGKVTVQSARLSGMRDFLVVPFSHTWLAWRSEVIMQIKIFLRSGNFTHDAPVGKPAVP